VQVQGDHLDRLAESHVVGEAATESGVAHGRQPGHPALLVRAECRLQARRRRQLRRCRREPRYPVREIGERAVSDDNDDLAVDLGAACQHGTERLHRPHPGARRPAQLRQQRWVKGHPPAPQPDQRPFRLRQFRDLVRIQQFPAEGELPAELQQRVQAEPSLGQPLWRGRGHCLQLEPVAEAGGPQHLDAGPRQCLGRGPEQAGHRVIVKLQDRGGGLLQQRGQRRPHRRAAPQRQQQVRVRLRAEPRQHALRLIP
jgi:hypothetical protein